MKIIRSLIAKAGNMEPENSALLSLVAHTFLWFGLGGAAGYVWAVCTHASGNLMLSYIITVGAVCALVLGYVGGVVYLLREEA